MNDSILPTIRSINKLFLSGPFGSGKSTLALERIRWLLRRERARLEAEAAR
jgi:DNA helicase IV